MRPWRWSDGTGRLWMAAGIIRTRRRRRRTATSIGSTRSGGRRAWWAAARWGWIPLRLQPARGSAAVFARQLEAARPTGLPIIIHCREAHATRFGFCSSGVWGRRVVFHCFSGNEAEARALWGHGWWTSFTGTITFKNATELRGACAAAAGDQLMFETTPPTFRRSRCGTCDPNGPRTWCTRCVSRRGKRGESFEAMAQRSTENAVRFFKEL